MSDDVMQEHSSPDSDPEVLPEDVRETGETVYQGGTDRLVPVGEAIRYRKRAQAAEQGLRELKGVMQDTQVELEQAKQAIDEFERRQKIDEQLVKAEVVDHDVARLLTETALGLMDEPDIKVVIDDLRRQKPYLFKNRSVNASHMSARIREGGHHLAGQAAEQAAVSGNRQDLLRYLRLRRKKQ